MKKFTAYSMCVVATLTGCATVNMTPVPENERTISSVIDAEGMKKEKIYNGSKVWIAENFKSAKAVLEYENKEDGTIIGNGIINYPCTGGMDCLIKSHWKVPFTMRVDTKDNKFRLTFTNINLSWPASYSSGIVSPAYNGPVALKSDMDTIRPKLLSFGGEIVKSLNSNNVNSNW